MRLPLPSLLAPALGSVLIAAFAFQTPVQAGEPKHARVARALKRDLQAIPSGSQPTDAQKRTLSADLGKLFRHVDPVPSVTLDFLVGKLADAVAQGQFDDKDLRALALAVTGISTGSVDYNHVAVANLAALLTKAGLGQTDVEAITNAVRALPTSFKYNYDGASLLINLQAVNAGTKGYKKPSGTATLTNYQTSVRENGILINPNAVGRTLEVDLGKVPRGRYHVSVTTGAGSQPVEIGTLRVRSGPGIGIIEDDVTMKQPTDATDADGSDDSGDAASEATGDGSNLSDDGATNVTPTLVTGGNLVFGHPGSSHFRTGTVTFGALPNNQPLPAGVTLAGMTGVTVADDNGVQQFTGSFVTPAPGLSRFAQIHLIAGTTAPTAGGALGFTNIYNPNTNFKGSSFLLAATGLPANATLTLSVDGASVEPVQTGPTGNLYVKLSQSVFPRPPASTETINTLPDTLDLSRAKAFAVSDAQGNVLLSGALED